MSGNKRRPDVPTLHIGPGRLSFPHLIEPCAEGFDVGKYVTTLLLPPDYDVRSILDAMADLCKSVWGRDPSKWNPTARRPEAVVRKCAEKPHLSGYEPGWWFLTVKSGEAPAIVDRDLAPVTDPKQIYAGRWVNISARPFLYDHAGPGVSLGLGNVQLLKHDKPFGRTRPEQDFDRVPEEEMADDF